LFPITDRSSFETRHNISFISFLGYFPGLLFPYFAPGINLYFTAWSSGGRNAVMLHASSFKFSCTSNMAFVMHVHQIKRKNSMIKSWKGLMMDGKHKMNTLYHLYAIGNLEKSLFSWVFLSDVERLFYIYLYVYDVVTRRRRWISVTPCQCAMNKRWRSIRCKT